MRDDPIQADLPEYARLDGRFKPRLFRVEGQRVGEANEISAVGKLQPSAGAPEGRHKYFGLGTVSLPDNNREEIKSAKGMLFLKSLVNILQIDNVRGRST